MAIGVLQNVGTVLRHANAALQEIAPMDGEKPPISAVQKLGSDLVAELDKLGVGVAPVPDGIEVVPTAAFIKLSELIMFDAGTRLSSLTEKEIPVQFSDIQELRNRIDKLNAGLAVAIIR